MKVWIQAVWFSCCSMLAVGCTWVEPAATAAGVRVATAGEVKACTKTGTTHVSVMDRLGVLERNQAKVAGELATLARNSAVELGGDTVVAITEIVDGTQTFAVYDCGR